MLWRSRGWFCWVDRWSQVASRRWLIGAVHAIRGPPVIGVHHIGDGIFLRRGLMVVLGWWDAIRAFKFPGQLARGMDKHREAL